MKKICHITTVHQWNDDRIFLKELQSLSNAGYESYLIAPGKERIENGIHVVGIGNFNGRKERILKASKVVFQKAIEIDADVYHFHDPELLPCGIKLKRNGKKVIFDSHEDVPAQILDKEWIPGIFRRIISKIYRMYETYAVKKFDAVIAATDHIANQFKKRAKTVLVINNYPKLDDIQFHENPFEKREKIICYAGGISEARGQLIMESAVEGIGVTLVMAGELTDEIVERQENRKNVHYIGMLNRQEVNKLYGRSIGGFVLLKPTHNYRNSLPIKMFEYMAAGLPFIASDFPIWKKIVEESKAGICVNPKDMNSIKDAILWITNNPEEAQKMGRRGRDCVIKKYNWKNEEKKLCDLYKKIYRLK